MSEDKKSFQKEQYAVYEKVPAHGSEVDGVILAPYKSKEEAEQARHKYGYSSDNYYIGILK
jgi:hypothetical protein